MSYIAEPVHREWPIKRWYNPKDSSHLERVKLTKPMQYSRFEWYLNGVQIDGFKASQLLKGSIS